MNFLDKIRSGTKILKSNYLKINNIISVEFLITNRCNLSCQYCIPLSDYIDNEDEMSLEEISEVFLKLNELNVERVNISGGEPLIRNDISDILRKAFMNRFKVTLTTNGILIPNYIDLLTDLDLLIISIDGGENTNNYLRGDGVYQLAVSSLELSRKKGIKALISAVITSKTREDDLAFLLKLCNFYDVFCILQPAWNIFFKPDTHEKCEKIKELIPDSVKIKHLVKLLKDDPNRARIVGGNNFLTFLSGIYKKIEKGIIFKETCMAGRSFLFISPGGKLFPCSLRLNALLDKPIQKCSAREIKEIKIKPIKCFGCHCYFYKIINDIAKLNFINIANFMFHYNNIIKKN